MLKKLGIDPARSSGRQFEWLKKSGTLQQVPTGIDSLDDEAFARLKPGDLLFWQGTYKGLLAGALAERGGFQRQPVARERVLLGILPVKWTFFPKASQLEFELEKSREKDDSFPSSATETTHDDPIFDPRDRPFIDAGFRAGPGPRQEAALPGQARPP